MKRECYHYCELTKLLFLCQYYHIDGNNDQKTFICDFTIIIIVVIAIMCAANNLQSISACIEKYTIMILSLFITDCACC